MSITKAIHATVDWALRSIPLLLGIAQWILSPPEVDLTSELASARRRAEKAVSSSPKEDNDTLTRETTTRDIQELGHVGWIYDAATKDWKKRVCCDDENNIQETLSVLTYNVMMDKYNKYIPGVIHSELRYKEIIKRLFGQDEFSAPDCICFNEIDAQFLRMLSNHPMVQQQYAMTDVTATSAAVNDAPTFDRAQFGVLVLVKRSFHVGLICTVCTKTKANHNKPRRPSVVVRIRLGTRNGTGQWLALVATHLEAFNSRFRQRCDQLFDLYSLASSAAGQNAAASPASPLLPAKTAIELEDQVLILGDFNFHQEAESAIIVGRYVDLWKYIHPDKPEQEGFTWDSQTNKLLARMLLGVDTRRMRLDRAIMTLRGDGKDVLIPKDMTLYGTDPFTLSNGQEIHASDHFGLLCQFQVAALI